MEIGPIEYAIVGFPGNRFKGEIVPELADLVAKGTINVIDFAFVKKDAAGNVTAFELTDLPADEAEAFGSFEAKIGSLLNEEDLQIAGDSLANDSSAAVLVWENAWAARLAQAVRNADGMLLEHQRIPHEV